MLEKGPCPAAGGHLQPALHHSGTTLSLNPPSKESRCPGPPEVTPRNLAGPEHRRDAPSTPGPQTPWEQDPAGTQVPGIPQTTIPGQPA